jgi:hypothetical protein
MRTFIVTLSNTKIREINFNNGYFNVSISTAIVVLSLPFLYFGIWAEELFTAISTIVRHSVGGVGIVLFFVSMVTWFFEIKDRH